MEVIYQEVDFKKYCKTCIYNDLDEVKDPCNECLSEPSNEYSCKPKCYKEE